MSIYQISIRILLGLTLWLSAIGGLRAQDPTNPPELPGNGAVTVIGDTDYSSLTEALQAITKDATVKLNISTTLGGTHALTHNVTLEMNGQTLTCSSGTTLTITGGKKVLFKNTSSTQATITGSFTFDGPLFISSTVSLGGTAVYKTGGTPHYRTLIALPAATGTVSNVQYGTLAIADALQEGDILCCWLPQSSATKPITYEYIATPGATPVAYLTDPLVVVGHTEKTVESRVDDGSGSADKSVASATPEGGSEQMCKTFGEALKAVRDKGGQVKLLSAASLGEAITFTKPVDIDLNKKSLTSTSSGTAAMLTSGDGKVNIHNGQMSGTFTITDALVADRTVTLLANLLIGTRQVYRVRLVLPDTDYNYYKYDVATYSGPVSVMTEDTDVAAYLWLSAHAATAVFTVAKDAAGTAAKSKNKVTIEANHDNQIDLKLGDTQVVVYTTAQPSGTAYENFHDALVAVEGENGSRIELRNHVALSGATDHPHELDAGVFATIDLNGHILTGSNCSFDAHNTQSCYLLTDVKGTGSLTGTLKIRGNIFVGSDIATGKIGTVQAAADGTQLYRMLVTVDDPDVTEGFASYTFGAAPIDVACYVKNGMACLWLPLDQQGKTLSLTKEGKTYSAKAVMVSATHSNTAQVQLPTIVAKIGNTEYTSLEEAFRQVTTDDTEIELCAPTMLNTPVTLSKRVKLRLEHPLRMEPGAAFTVTGSGGLYIYNPEKQGTLTGDFSVSEGVYISSSVPLTGQVSLNTVPHYRAQLILPLNTTVADYRFGSQSGAVYLSGEKTALNKPLGYAWLSADKRDLTVRVTAPTPTQNYTLLEANVQPLHTNRFDMEAGGNVAQIGNQYYPSLATALVAANATGGTIVLTADVVLRDKHEVTRPVSIDLNGYTLNATADAFLSVSDKQTLCIYDDATTPKGQLYGTLRIQGNLYVAPEVSLAGTLVCEGKEVFRQLIEGLPAGEHLLSYDRGGVLQPAQARGGTACLWLWPVTKEHDLSFAIDAVTYETTRLPGLPDHNARQKAYRLVTVKAADTNEWLDEAYTDCNVMLEKGAVLTIPAASTLARLHRVTLMNDAQIVCEKAELLAIGGIIYRRQFTKSNRWEAFSLPYEARRITALQEGEQIEMQPYQATGTGGHFWLKTLSSDGSFSYVTEEKVKANIGYIIAVPQNLTTEAGADIAVDFVSADNQYLQRTPVPALAPVTKGFKQLANGTLQAQTLTQPFYQLSDDGKAYERQDDPAASPIAPFSSYLLADQATVAAQARFVIGELPTANETIAQPSATEPLQLYTRPGYLLVRTPAKVLLLISTPDGRLVRVEQIPEGETEIALPRGIYFVNRHKVVVR